MSIILELSSRNYLDDKLNVKKALSHLETLCEAWNGYTMGEPEEKAGWTFFKLKLKPELHEGIEKKFSDMIGKYRWSNSEEKFRKFMEEYFQAKNCNVKVKIVSA